MREQANGPPVVVRLGTAADAHDAARLHADLIAEGFLARLGPRFLSRLYRRVVRSPDAFLLVADGDGSTAGFLAGSLDLGALYRRFIVHDGFAAAVWSLPRLLGSWRHAWETLRHGNAGARSRADAAGAGSDAAGARAGSDATAAGAGSDATAAGAELLAIAVDPAWRGQHVGTLLVDGFLAELDNRGVASAQVVVGADNAAAIALYRRSGFEPDHTFELHRGTASLLMRRAGDGGRNGRGDVGRDGRGDGARDGRGDGGPVGGPASSGTGAP